MDCVNKQNSYWGTPFDLVGRVALVSGGGGLLGREFCKALLSAGADVVMADTRLSSLEAAEAEVKERFPDARFMRQTLDVTDNDSVTDCVGNTVDAFGTIDILVNSAAIDPKFEKGSDTSRYSGFPDFPRHLFEESLQVNLTGAFLLTQAVCCIMEKKASGSIINLGSNYGLVGPDQRIYKRNNSDKQDYKPVVYSVCKAGIIGFTKYLAAYYAGTNIRVNILTPSGVYNEHDREFEKNYADRTILRRMSVKDEFWGGVLFLASDASSYMTGSNLVIDGGWTAL